MTFLNIHIILRAKPEDAPISSTYEILEASEDKPHLVLKDVSEITEALKS